MHDDLPGPPSGVNTPDPGVLRPWMVKAMAGLPGTRSILLYAALLSLRDRSGTVRVSNQVLTDLTGIDDRNIRRGLLDLKGAGLVEPVEPVSRKGAAVTYRLPERDSIFTSSLGGCVKFSPGYGSPGYGSPGYGSPGYGSHPLPQTPTPGEDNPLLPGIPLPPSPSSLPLLSTVTQGIQRGLETPERVGVGESIGEGSGEGEREGERAGEPFYGVGGATAARAGFDTPPQPATPVPPPAPPQPAPAAQPGLWDAPHANGNGPRIGAEPQTRPALPPDPSAAILGAADAVPELFRLWQQATGHSRARLDEKRRGVLRRALTAYGFPECALAIRGLGLSDWHMGRDPQTNGKSYNEPENVFRSAAHVERFVRIAEEAEKPAPAMLDPDMVSRRWQDLADEFYRERARGGDLHTHDGVPPPGAEKFRDGFRPLGRAHVLGEAVLVFDDHELLWFANNLAAARYAGRRLREEYQDHDLAVWTAQRNIAGAESDLREAYRRACSRPDSTDTPTTDHAA